MSDALPMMPAAEWDRKLIADLVAERARLREPKMMRVPGLAAAPEGRLLGDIAQALPVAIALRRGNREHALVDAVGVIPTGETPGVHSFTMPQVVHTVLFA